MMHFLIAIFAASAAGAGKVSGESRIRALLACRAVIKVRAA